MSAASRYYSQVPSQLDLSNTSESQPMSSPLKPIYLAQAHPHAGSPGDEVINHLERSDTILKDRIRVLRVISRVASVVISLCIFVPIAITLEQFLKTRNTYRSVPSGNTTIDRTAWAHNTKAWPTYMYFSIALLSLVLNILIMFAYIRSIKTANRVATVSITFDWIIIAVNLGVWVAAVIVYKNEKDKVEAGVHNDLWGWSCSDAAAKIQGPFNGVLNFGRLCNVQSSSWYIGLLHVGYLVLSAIIVIFVFMRRKSKVKVQKRMTDLLLNPQ